MMTIAARRLVQREYEELHKLEHHHHYLLWTSAAVVLLALGGWLWR